MAALVSYDYTTDYAEFAVDSPFELSKLPTTSRGGTGELAWIDHPIKAGYAYTTNGSYNSYTLNSASDTWMQNR